MNELLSFAVHTAQEAAKLALPFFRTGVEVEYKSDQSPVTAADRAVEQSLRSALRENYPDHGILGEEEGESGDSSLRWVIDPIDGTKSFICGVPLFATLLSFEVDQEPVLGVAVFPALNEVVYAMRGEGCFWNGQRAQVSRQTDLSRATICCGSHKSLLRYGRMDGLARLAEQCQATRTWCDAYGHCLVATGRVEAMVDPVVEHYDLSAMKVILAEAGGRMTDFSGANPLRTQPNGKCEAVSSNGVLHNAVLEAF